MSVLAIDAGTTGVTALVVRADGTVAARGYQEFRQYYPHPGWVEHLPEDIWQATLAAGRQALDQAAVKVSGGGEDPEPVTALGITNQRETAVVWDPSTLAAPRRAIVWQDRRTARICAELREAGHELRVNELTGLRLDPYFTGTKLTWLAVNEPAIHAGLADGSLVADVKPTPSDESNNQGDDMSTFYRQCLDSTSGRHFVVLPVPSWIAAAGPSFGFNVNQGGASLCMKPQP